VIQEIAVQPPTFSEEQLLSIYEELLSLPDGVKEHERTDTRSEAQIQEGVDVALIETVDQRLRLDTSLRSTSLTQGGLAERILGDKRPVLHLSELPPVNVDLSAPAYQRVLAHVEMVTQRLEQARVFAPKEGDSKVEIPVAILSAPEWQALVRVCVRPSFFSLAHLLNRFKIAADDGAAAERAIEVMKVA
jgi:hypothetical protein